MGQETVGVYSFQGTLQDKVDRGQRVACSMGVAFQQSPSREGGRSCHKIRAVILKRTITASGITCKCLVSFPSDTALG